MWSTPVTFGGGTAMEKFSSGVPPGSGWCSPEAIQRSTIRGSTSAGSKRVRSASVLIEGRSVGRSGPVAACSERRRAGRPSCDPPRAGGELEGAGRRAEPAPELVAQRAAGVVGQRGGVRARRGDAALERPPEVGQRPVRGADGQGAGPDLLEPHPLPQLAPP